MDADRRVLPELADTEIVHIGPEQPWLGMAIFIAIISMVYGFTGWTIINNYRSSSFSPELAVSFGAFLLFFVVLLGAVWAKTVRDLVRGRPFLKITPDGLVYSRINKEHILPWDKMSEIRVERRDIADEHGDVERSLYYFVVRYSHLGPDAAKHPKIAAMAASLSPAEAVIASLQYPGQGFRSALATEIQVITPVTISIPLNDFAMDPEQLGELLRQRAHLAQNRGAGI